VTVTVIVPAGLPLAVAPRVRGGAALGTTPLARTIAVTVITTVIVVTRAIVRAALMLGMISGSQLTTSIMLTDMQ
jgi:hypothetical protein